MPKTLVIIYHKDDWDAEIPFERSPDTRAAFESFYDFARKKDVEVFRADIRWFDTARSCFKKAWTFRNDTWIRQEGPIIPDAIFDKMAGKRDYEFFVLKTSISNRIQILNTPLFRTMFDNKLSQYLAFREFMPQSLLAENDEHLKEAIARIRTGKVVIKQIYGSGGKEVVIGDKTRLIETGVPLSFPVLVQEFIGTSGIPGFSESEEVSDLRIVYVGKVPIYALSRIAKSGSLFTNFHQGATARIVPMERIPADCLRMADAIRKTLDLFENTNYSLDFMFSTDGTPFFVEMNTTPGFDLLHIMGTSELKECYFESFLRLLR
ncbi:MAG: hypothetical protein HGA31_02305 [Candidatus Moranbacteria bacterium]|nr:hypothetical protein [Candidatus Moranbacteria bacterium]